MNSNNTNSTSPTRNDAAEPTFFLELPSKLPSWNQVLAMHHWKRKKFKDDLAKEFLCALRASATDCSTKTTFAKNTMLTCADTLERCLTTRRIKSKSRSANAKLRKAKENERKS